MRIVIISDTHGQHDELGILSGDVLIHCGDFCHGFMNDGEHHHAIDEWFGKQQFDRIFCVGGNHDFLAQNLHSDGHPVFENANYLVDQSQHFHGVTFFGSPWLPDLDGWANYMLDRQRKKKWKAIPETTDVLITHTPPNGTLDKPRSGRHIGCEDLRIAVERIQPKVHCFGHVHASRGRVSKSGTEFVNATVVNSEIEVAYEPFVVDLEP